MVSEYNMKEVTENNYSNRLRSANNNNALIVTIPQEIVKKLDLQVGDQLCFNMIENNKDMKITLDIFFNKN